MRQSLQPTYRVGLLVLLTLCMPTSALAAFPTDEQWIPLPKGGAVQEDPQYDVAASNAVDIVGDASNPAVYWWADADDIAFRFRLEEDPRDVGSTLRDTYGLLIDTDGDDSNYECTVQIRTVGTVLGMWRNSTIEEGDWQDRPNSVMVWSVGAPMAGGTPSVRATLVGAGDSGFGGDEDYFVDLRIPRFDASYHCRVDPAAYVRYAIATQEDSSSLGALTTDLAGVVNLGGTPSLATALSDAVAIDPDRDDLTTPAELALGTDPELADSDGDTLNDGVEVDAGTDPNLADTDGDLLDDAGELAEGSDPLNPDTDGDGALDGREVNGGTSPLEPDTDLDGLGDLAELDCDETAPADDRDMDTLADIDEGEEDTDRDFRPNWCDPDDDGDGIPSEIEGNGDIDEDEIPNHLDVDADGDRTPDYEEGRGDDDCDALENWADVEDDDGPCGDLDHDGLPNSEEGDCGTDPELADTDGDGILDGDEDCDEDGDGDGIPDPLDPDDDGTDGSGGNADGPESTVQPIFGLGKGTITGGACSSIPLRAAWIPAALALGLAIGRRRKSGLVAVPLVVGVSFAASEAQAQEINGQTLKPAIGEDDFFAIDDSAVGPERFGGALLYNHARDPLVWRYPSGATQSILETVHTLDIQAWGVLGPVRLGLDVPFNMGVQGLGISEGEAGVAGDIRLDGRWEILERGASPVGVAMLGGVQTPTGDGEAFVGEPAWSGTLRGAFTAGNADRFVAVNMGFLFTEKEPLPDDAVFGSRFTWGLGGTLPLVGPVAGSAELVGARFLGSAGGAAATPLEGLVSLRARLPEGVVLSAGTGFGLTEGMGAPRYRILAGIQGHFGNSVTDEAGILDAAPGRTPTSLEFIAEDGARISEAIFTLESGPQTAQLNTPHDSALVVHLKPGIYGFSVEAAGFEPITGVMEVPVAASHEQRIAMARVRGGCNVTVRVTDTQEAPVAATVAASRGGQKSDTQAEATNGIARFQISPGEAWELIISSPGYSTEHRAVACARGADGQLANVEKEVVLVAPRARLEGSRVIIMDKVNFALDQDRILAEGKGILDDVAKVLKEHPEIRKMEIQGHTDLRGPAGYNLTLSQRRAEQVKRYLVSVHGIEADRLTAKGYGESAPMIAASDKEADEANRRVEFHVIEQD